MLRRANFVRVDDRGWDDRPLAIVGTGPSLRGFDLSRLDRPDLRVLAVKEAVFDLPFAAECVFIHGSWLRNRGAALAAQPVPVTMVTDNVANPSYEVLDHISYVERTHGDGLSNDPRFVNHGGTSGYAALNVATLRGARDVLLLGFDYRVAGRGDVPGHHYNDAAYPWYMASRNYSMWAGWAKNFEKTLADLRALGAAVHIGTRETAVTAFPYADPAAWLDRRAAA